MAWEGRVVGPISTGFFGRRIYSRARIMIGYREIPVDSPMVEYRIVPPDFGFHLSYATDLYQRAYVMETKNNALERSIVFHTALHSAPDPGGGEVPLDDATWTLIPGTESGGHRGTDVFYERMDPPLFDGLVFTGLWTWVYQSSDLWRGPFTVRHELWGNAHRWTRATPEETFGRGSGYSTGMIDMNFRLQSKVAP